MCIRDRCVKLPLRVRPQPFQDVRIFSPCFLVPLCLECKEAVYGDLEVGLWLLGWFCWRGEFHAPYNFTGPVPITDLSTRFRIDQNLRPVILSHAVDALKIN